jgi:hypothetical protein
MFLPRAKLWLFAALMLPAVGGLYWALMAYFDRVEARDVAARALLMRHGVLVHHRKLRPENAWQWYDRFESWVRYGPGPRAGCDVDEEPRRPMPADAVMEAVNDMSNVTLLDLSGTECNAATLELLVPTLRRLRTVRLQNTAVGDECVPQLAQCRNLEGIVLSQTRLTGTGLRKLFESVRPTSLGLDCLELGDADLNGLDAARITSLSLDGTRITDDWIAARTTLASLTCLSLSRTRVTALGIAMLSSRAPNLRQLSLAELPVDDPTAAGLLRRGSIETIDLQGTAVTEELIAGIARTGFGKLRRLFLPPLQLSDQDIQAVRSQWPNAEIFGGESSLEISR